MCSVLRMKDPFPIVKKLGGRDAVAEILRGRGISYKSGYYAVYQWTRRKQISVRAVLALQAHCDENGIDYETSDFLIPATEQKEVVNGVGELPKGQAMKQ